MLLEHEAMIDALRGEAGREREGCVWSMVGQGCIKKGSGSLIPSSSERKGLVSKTGRGPTQL